MASSTLIRLVGSKFFQRQAGIEANPKSRLGAPRLPTRTTHPAHPEHRPLVSGSVSVATNATTAPTLCPAR
jgi:hypothetical protein